jgi:hypothetical protein
LALLKEKIKNARDFTQYIVAESKKTE